MLKKSFIFALFASIIFTACKKNIEFELENSDDFLVLKSILTPDSTFQAELSSSKFVTNLEASKIKNAKVEIFSNGKLVEQLKYNSKRQIWKGSQKPSLNKEYEVKASADGFKTVSGTTTILPPVAFSDVDYNFSDSYSTSASFKIKDPKNTDNFFRLYLCTEKHYKTTNKAYVSYGNFWIKNGIGYSIPYLKSNDPVLNINNDDEKALEDLPNNKFWVFSDDLFRNELYKLKFTFTSPFSLSTGYNQTGQPEKEKINKYILNTQLKHISRELYLYYKTIDANSYYNDNPFSEPVQIYTNVKNGAGVVGSYSVSSHQIDLLKIYGE